MKIASSKTISHLSYETERQLLESFNERFKNAEAANDEELLAACLTEMRLETDSFVAHLWFDLLEVLLLSQSREYEKALQLATETKVRLAGLVAEQGEHKLLSYLQLKAHLVSSVVYGNLQEFESSIDESTRVYEIALELDIAVFKVQALQNLSCVFYCESNYDKSLEYCQLAYKTAQSGGVALSVKLCECFTLSHADLGNYEQAIQWGRLSLEKAEAQELWYQVRDIHFTCAYVYLLMNKASVAHEHLQMAGQTEDKLSAPSQQDQILRSIPHVLTWIQYYAKIGDFESARDCFDNCQGLDLWSTAEKLDLYERVQDVFIMLDDRDRAIEVFEAYQVITKELYSQHRAAAESKQELRFKTASAEAEAKYNLKLFESEQVHRKEIEKLLTEERKISEALNVEKSRVELMSLARQIDPQFIFDSLSSISSFVAVNDPEAANRYLSQYSKLMRMTLNYSLNDLVTLEEELEVLRLYLGIAVLRFGKCFEYELLVEPEVDVFEHLIPPMILQPIVEQAIWQRLQYCVEPNVGKLSISVSLEPNSLLLTICDIAQNQSKSANEASAISDALSLLDRRLQILNRLSSEPIRIVKTNKPLNELQQLSLAIITIPRQGSLKK